MGTLSYFFTCKHIIIDCLERRGKVYRNDYKVEDSANVISDN